MLLLHSDDNESRFFYRFNRTSSHHSLLFRISGIMSATPFTAREVGRLRYRVRNKVLVDADCDFLQAYAKIVGGSAEATLGASAAFSYSFVLPRYHTFANVELIEPGDNALFSVDFDSNVGTQATNFLAELYAIPDEGLNPYQLRMIQSENTVGTGRFPLDSPTGAVENIAAMYLSDIVGGALTVTGSNIDRFEGQIGNQDLDASVVASLEATRAKSPGAGSAFADCVEVHSADMADLAGRLYDSADLKVDTSGAATPQLLTLGYDFNPDKQLDAAQLRNAVWQGQLRRKAGQGMVRNLAGLRQLTGEE